METDPILTAWALNELPLDQQSAVEEALLHDPRLRGEAAAVQGFCRFLSSQLHDSETALTEAQRGYVTGSADSLRPLRYISNEPAVIVRRPTKVSRTARWWRENHEVVVPLAAAAVLVLASVWFVYHDRQLTAPAQTTAAAPAAAAAPAQPPAPMRESAGIRSGGASMVENGSSPRFSSTLSLEGQNNRSAGDWSRQAVIRSGASTGFMQSSAGGKVWSAVPRAYQSSSQDTFTILTGPSQASLGRAVARIEVTHSLPQVVAGRKSSTPNESASLGADVSAVAGLQEAPPPLTEPGGSDSPLTAFFQSRLQRLSVLAKGDDPISREAARHADPSWSREVRDLVSLPAAELAREPAREALLDRTTASDARVAAFPQGGAWTDARQQRPCQVPLPLGYGSFATLRRRLGAGQRPFPEEIRLEEWINAFAFEEAGAAGAAGDHPLVLHHETAGSPWQQGSRLVRVVISRASAGLAAEINGVTLEFDPMRVRAYRIVGFENRGNTFPMGLPVPETAPQTSLAILAEFVPATPSTADAAALVVTVRYDLPDGRQGVMDAPVRDSGAALAACSTDMRFTAAVAAFGHVLQAPAGRDTASDLLRIRQLARESLGEDRDGRRGEFLLMMDRARAMVAGKTRL